MALARASDLLITFAITPTLEGEQNIFVSHFGLGWWTLILVNGAAVVAVGALVLHGHRRRNQLVPRQAGLSFSGFASHYMVGIEGGWRNVFFKFPKGADRNVFVAGNLTATVIIIGSIWLDVSHIMSFFVPGWIAVHNGLVGQLWLLALGLALVSLLGLLAVEYLLYRRRRQVVVGRPANL